MIEDKIKTFTLDERKETTAIDGDDVEKRLKMWYPWCE